MTSIHNCNLVLLPGLGLDHRLFEHLDLHASGLYKMDWIEPLHRKEPLQEYAGRWANQLPTRDRLIIAGHSFGGIIAQEMTRFLPVEKVLLISSIRSPSERPLPFQLSQWFPVHRILPKAVLGTAIPWIGPKHGYDTPELQQLAVHMFNKYSATYHRWALDALSTWTGFPDLNTPIERLHGDLDATFPIQKIHDADILPGGDHVMIYKQSREISAWINAQLKH